MTKTTRPKGDIFGKSKELIKKGTVSTKKWYLGTGRPAAEKAAKKAAKSYAKYGKPSVTLGKRLLKWGVVKPAKLALRFPGAALVATGAYYGAKHLGKKWGRGYNYSPVRQFDKKGRKRLSGVSYRKGTEII
jgi:hypothetical protein